MFLRSADTLRFRPADDERVSGAPLVLLATGSTGGHVTPALAVAEALKELDPSIRTMFCGPAGGVAERLVSSNGGAFVPLEVHPLRGAGAGRWLRGLVQLPVGMLSSFRLLRRLKPDVVVGTGAHTSGPLLALAAWYGVPTLLFEANVEVGLANRWLGRLVQGAAVAWPGTLGSFPSAEFLSGWPVSQTIRECSPRDATQTDRFHVLILGGSAGAADLDRAMRDALPHLGPLAQRLSVVHQASPSEVATLRDQYKAAGIDAVVESFFADMASQYQRASLVVTRSGAATLGELAAVGRPAILVPLPAAGDHQLANARAWTEAGCARVILPHALDDETLAAAILSLAHDPSELERMGAAAKARHRPDAALRMAEWCQHAVRSR